MKQKNPTNCASVCFWHIFMLLSSDITATIQKKNQNKTVLSVYLFCKALLYFQMQEKTWLWSFKIIKV